MSLAKLVPVKRIKYLSELSTALTTNIDNFFRTKFGASNYANFTSWIEEVLDASSKTKIRDVTIDDFTFRLHYRFTFSFLLIGSILLTGEQFFGKPIQCIKGNGVPAKVIESYCWIEGTFTLPRGLMKVIGFEVAAPGVEQFTEVLKDAKNVPDEVIGHSYYQWVGVVLFLQAITFYVTHLLWKNVENRKVQTIINGLNKMIMEPSKKSSARDSLVTYLLAKRGHNNSYAFKYFLCELANLFIVIAHMIFLNSFLGGEFTTYGLEVLRFLDQDPSVRVDPMAKVFPKMTKCTFRKFGPGGDVQKFDHLCMLPLNILNEKMFVAYWFWFYFVFILSAIAVVYRILVIAFPNTRHFLLARFGGKADPEDVEIILDNSSYSDWFLLYLLGASLDPMHNREVLKEYAHRLQNDPSLLPEDAREVEKFENDSNDEESSQKDSKV